MGAPRRGLRGLPSMVGVSSSDSRVEREVLPALLTEERIREGMSGKLVDEGESVVSMGEVGLIAYWELLSI